MPGPIKYFHRRPSSGGTIERDPYWYAVGLLLKGKTDAVNGGQNNTILDSSSNNFTVTRNGNVSPGSLSPYGGSGGSLYFDGTGDNLQFGGQAGFSFGTGDFTIEFWMWAAATTQDLFLFDFRGAGDNTAPRPILYTKAGALFDFHIQSGVLFSSSIPYVARTWTHIAICRSGTTTRMFQNGVQSGSATDSNNYLVGTNRPIIGANRDAGAGFVGAISDFRVVKGTALYTAAFTPPTVPLTAVANTQLLLSGSNANLTDSVNGTIVETAGNAQASTTITKFNSTSMYFDGTGDKLELKANPEQWSMSNGNFTVECWVYPTSTTNAIYVSTNSSFGGFEIQVIGTNWVFNSSSNGASFDIANGIIMGPVTINTWQHLAICRVGGKIKLFKNGVLINTVVLATVTTALMYCIQGIGVWCRVNGTAASVAGYIDELRITKGIARYTSDFTPPIATFPSALATTNGDLYYDQVVFHSHFEGVNLSTQFMDQKGKTITPTGSSIISQTQKKFGNTAGYFDTATNLVTITSSSDFAFSTNLDFTIEFWIYPLSYGGTTAGGQCFGTTAGSQLGYSINLGENQDSFRIIANVGGNWQNYLVVETGGGPALNTWTHMAIVRNGDQAYIFKNGTRVARKASGAIGCNFSGTNAVIGRYSDGVTTRQLNSYIDEMRITKGVARYVDNFTVPSATFPDYTDYTNDPYLKNSIVVKVPTGKSGNNNTFLDSSSNNFAITRTGNTSQGTFSPFSNGGFSAYFDAGHSMTIPNNASQYVGTGDWTYEMWFNAKDVTTGLLVTKRNSSACSQFHIALTASSIWFGGSINGGSWDAFSANVGSVRAGTWYHIALVRSGNNLTAYVNGKGVLLLSTAWTPYNNAVPMLFGQDVAGGSGGFKGYMHGARLVVGTAVYTADFTPPTSNVTAISGTSFLLMQDNRWVDRSTNNSVATVTTNVYNVPFSPFVTTYNSAVNGGSMYFDGAGDYLQLPSSASLALGTGDFTIDGWFYKTVTGRQAIYTSISSSADSWKGINVYVDASNLMLCTAYSSGGVNIFNATHQTTVTLNTWHHFAFTRTSGVGKMFLDGVVSSYSGSMPDSLTQSGSTIGAAYPTTDVWNGYISDLRILKGTSLYSTSFTPPTAPVTVITNTQLLISGTNASVIDATGRFNLETGGSVKTDSINKKYGTATSHVGTSDYCTSDANAIAMINNNDFTMECWVKITGNTAVEQNLIYFGSQSGMALTMNAMASFRLFAAGSYILNIAPAGGLAIGVWYHVAVSRFAGTIYGFVNGVNISTSGNLGGNTVFGKCWFGGSPTGSLSGASPLTALVEDVRYTVGIGRYFTNFQPPLRSLPSV